MDNKDFIRVSEGHFTPYSYVPTNPALRGLGLRMPQFTPEQLEQSKKEAWLRQTSGAVEPVAYADIVPSMVKDVTGSDALALASGFFSPSSFVKKAPKALELISYHGPKAEWEKPSLTEMAKHRGKSEQGFGFYTTDDPEMAVGFAKHSKGRSIKEFDIPDDMLHTALNRTKPLSDQTPYVTEKLMAGLQKEAAESPFSVAMRKLQSKGLDSATGSDLYNTLVLEYAKQLSIKDIGEARYLAQIAASRTLDNLGIPMAVYTSAGGRTNHVIWNQGLLDSMQYKNIKPPIPEGGLIGDFGLIK